MKHINQHINKQYVIDHIQREIMARLYANYPFALVGLLIIATAIFLELHFYKIEGLWLTNQSLVIWYLSVIVVIAARVSLYSWHLIDGDNPRSSKTQYWLLGFFSSLTAVLFGIIGSLMMPNDIAHQSYILILIS